MSKVTLRVKKKAVKMYKEGISKANIAKHLKISFLILDQIIETWETKVKK